MLHFISQTQKTPVKSLVEDTIVIGLSLCAFLERGLVFLLRAWLLPQSSFLFFFTGQEDVSIEDS